MSPTGCESCLNVDFAFGLRYNNFVTVQPSCHFAAVGGEIPEMSDCKHNSQGFLDVTRLEMTYLGSNITFTYLR